MISYRTKFFCRTFGTSLKMLCLWGMQIFFETNVKMINNKKRQTFKNKIVIQSNKMILKLSLETIQYKYHNNQKKYGDFYSEIHKFDSWRMRQNFCLKHQKYNGKITKNMQSTLQIHFWWWIMFCSHICKDINDRNTKARFMFQNTQKNAWKILENLETRKNRVTDKKYGKSGATA